MLIDQMKKTFAERCRKNPAYSLRSFARSLDMDASTVSAILNGKRSLTLKSARKIVQGLHVGNPVEAQNILAATFAEDPEELVASYEQMSIEASEAIAFWQHHAILAALELKNLRPQAKDIAERLRIPLGTAWECLGRLERLGLVTKKGTEWKLSGKNMATPADVPSISIREGLRQYIEKGMDSLAHDPVESRDMSGITMAVSRDRLKGAKKLIQDFRRNLSAFMEDGAPDAVYRLNVQLYPLSQETKK